MKLTEDDFIISTLVHIETNEEIMKQILKNQEDVEKLREDRNILLTTSTELGDKLEMACDDAAMQLMKRQEAEAIVERLKKLVKELGEYQGLLEHPIYLELQKILGEN